MSNFKKRSIRNNKQISNLDYILNFFKIQKSSRNNLKLNNKSKNNITSNIALYIIDNFTKISNLLNKSFRNIVKLNTSENPKSGLVKENIIALEYTHNINTTSSKSQVDFFSFRLKDLSINYHLNSISPNLLRTSLEKESNKNGINDVHIVESPNFLHNDKTLNYLEKQVSKKNEKTLEQVCINNQNVFVDNLNSNSKSSPKDINLKNINLNNSGYKRTKTLESYKIIHHESSQSQHNKSVNDFQLKEGKTERKYSNDINDNVECLLNDNNSVSNGSEIDLLRREFAENNSVNAKAGDTSSNVNNISVSNLEAEKTCSEVSSTNNFSIQESGCSNLSQERFKKIRGFNFKNNVNTKKFSRQNVGKNSSVDKNIVVDINISNNNLASNTKNEQTTGEAKKLSTEEILKDKNMKIKKFNFNNNIGNFNLKKYKSPSPNSENKDKN